MAKKKIVFVVAGLHRAGAERFAYEIDAALDKSIYNLSILCLEEKGSIATKWKERYYEKKHLELGTPITYKDEFLTKKKTFFTRLQGFLYRKFKIKKKKENSKLVLFLDSFDVIHWMGEYTYIHSVPDFIKEKSLINVMSAKFQDVTIYDSFDFNYPYHIISGFQNEEAIYEFNQFKNIKTTFFPLAFKIKQVNNPWKFQDNKIKKIGIFTRLDRYKPLDPFFYSFQLLLDKIPNCELHIFGNGDPKAEGVIDYLERLNITDKVIFRGHQEDIVQTAINEHLDVSWFQGYNNDRPAGYAGFDICTTGTPLVCWDFYAKPTKPFNTKYPHFKNLNAFVNFSLEILTDKIEAEALSNVQFTDVLETRNMDNLVYILEDLYESFSKRN